jgi:hypothetical protein
MRNKCTGKMKNEPVKRLGFLLEQNTCMDIVRRFYGKI